MTLQGLALWRLSLLLRDFDAVNERYQGLNAMVGQGLRPRLRHLNLPQTIPGIARSSAHGNFGERASDTAKAFPDAAGLGAWAGGCPGNDESAGKRRSARVCKETAPLRSNLAECASGAARSPDSQIHG